MSTTTKEDVFLSDDELLHGLDNLYHTLQHLNDKVSSPHLSHYRGALQPTVTLPEAVSHSYLMLHDGALLVHATSTKYTLMGKIDRDTQSKMCSSDLIKGCQYLATGCLVLLQDSTGCSRAVRKSVKQATCAILQATKQLVMAFKDGSATAHLQEEKDAVEHPNNIGAQKTGAVWDCCNVILEKRLPVGNRNAMRRELLVFAKECNETMEEFQELIDLGPALREEDENEEGEQQATAETEKEEDAGWEAFLCGKSDQYTDAELTIVEAGIALIKCTRGSINLLLQACEAVGEQVVAATNQQQQQQRLDWISHAHELGRNVGEGMTDMGSTFYPPLQLQSVEEHVERQANDVETLLNFIVDATLPTPPTNRDTDTDPAASRLIDFPEDVTELGSKLKVAIVRRRKEVMDALSKAKQK